jgi:IS1 family transposase/transposase-like protein
MIVQACNHSEFKKHGRNATGKQRLRCKCCGHSWLEDKPEPLGNMRISLKDACTVLGMLLEGMSIRATSRITGIHYDTIGDLILTVGENCQALLESISGVEVRDVECDEIWSFIGLKEKGRALRGYGPEFGDSWTWIAVESHTKLVLSHKVGDRDADTCWAFLERLRDATTGRFQVSTDGLAAYRLSVPFVLRDRVDYGQLVKNYASSQTTTRYSPAKIISSERKARFGNPDFNRICTSHVERVNLTLRMQLRRFTRLTNGHSKSPKHHKAMQAIFFAWYNWCRKHETIKTSPAVASKLAEKIWTIRELLENAAEKNHAATN